MRINLTKAFELSDYNKAAKSINGLSLEEWHKFAKKVENKKETKQMTLF
jgi:hypothetical protein